MKNFFSDSNDSITLILSVTSRLVHCVDAISRLSKPFVDSLLTAKTQGVLRPQIMIAEKSEAGYYFSFWNKLCCLCKRNGRIKTLVYRSDIA